MKCRVIFSLSGLLLSGSCLAALAAADKAPPPVRPSAQPAADKSKLATPEALAHRMWIITEAVLENHFNPPARQTMLLASLQTLVNGDNSSRVYNLSRRVSNVTTEEQWTKLLRENWSKAAGEKIPPANRMQVMLEGLSSSVPGGVTLLDPVVLKVVEQTAGNRYVGTGIQIAFDQKEKLTQVRLAFRNGPAYRAGMKTDDFIVAVDGVKTHGMSIRQVIDLIRGDEGTPVTIAVRQPNSKETRSLKMIRSVVPFETVVGHRRASEDGWSFRIDPAAPIAYLQLKSLTSSIVHELRQKEAQLRAEGFHAVILDMRFNAGGSIHEAALLADALLDGGVIWRTRDAKDQVKEVQADRDCLFRDWPVAVLVNDRVVHASDAVARAWQDKHRVLIVGERSEGECYMNGRVPLPEGQGELLIRTGLVERVGPVPSGGGIKPDHQLSLTKEQARSLNAWFAKQEQPFKPGNANEPAPEDPQLVKAIEALKAALKTTNQVGKGG